jgi:hypothetical protein
MEPRWLLSRKAAATADTLDRLSLTHLRRQLCTATIEHLSDMCKRRRRIPRPAIDVNRTESQVGRNIWRTRHRHHVLPFTTSQAWHRNVSGIAKGPLPFFWGSTRPFETPADGDIHLHRHGVIGPNPGCRQQLPCPLMARLCEAAPAGGPEGRLLGRNRRSRLWPCAGRKMLIHKFNTSPNINKPPNRARQRPALGGRRYGGLLPRQTPV